MKTGIGLIEQERDEQILKHGRTTATDKLFNQEYQLCYAANTLLHSPLDDQESDFEFIPKGWNWEVWDKMRVKPYKERLIIAGALIAAEIDRLQAIQ